MPVDSAVSPLGRRYPIVAPSPAGLPQSEGEPTFSVVIPAFNARSTIGAAIASVLEQTLPAREIVVVDDGSTDGTHDVVEGWVDHVVYVRTANRGVSAARNKGLRHATASFVAPLDADDVWLPERLEALAALATARPDLDLLATNVVYEQAGRRPWCFYSGRNPFPVADQRTTILSRSFLQHGAIRRTKLEAVGGYDESITLCEDWDLWQRLIFDGAQAGLVDQPLLRYRRHPGSLSANAPAMLETGIAFQRTWLQRDDLSDGERATLREGIEERLRLLELNEIRHAVHLRQPGWRQRSRRVALSSGFPARTRLRAGAVSLLPGAALRLLNRNGPAADGHPAT
jgi:GT2 family glycosyltransferase